jgi:hypothetical protein
VLGVSEALAKVLLLALGEAASRPRAAALTAALRAEWMHAGDGRGGRRRGLVGGEVAAGAALAVGA